MHYTEIAYSNMAIELTDVESVPGVYFLQQHFSMFVIKASLSKYHLSLASHKETL